VSSGINLERTWLNSSVVHLPRVVRRQSAISGWGVYAAQPIAEDTRIVEYKGELVSQAEAWRREQRYLPRQRIWIFTIDHRLARDAGVGGNVARYINHACNPNCYVDIVGRHIWILASRDIRAGEELTYDYNTDGIAGIPCRCRPRCRRML
jgi:SET domain-containing protein